ncbi:MAG: penicillin-binding protein 2 [Gammaproteobacteria bacterium]
MAQPLTLRDLGQENRIFIRRVVVMVAVVGVLAALLVGRLALIQIVEHDHYKVLSQENRVKVLPLPPARGLIYSRDGVLIAENRPSFSLEIIPERARDLDQTITDLAVIIALDEAEIDRFQKELKQKRPFESIALKVGLSEREVAVFSVNRHRFPGVDIVARPTRFYPLGALMAHAVGYVGRIDEEELQRIDRANYSGTTHMGKTGVEKSYEQALHGRVGYQQVEVNAEGQVLRVLEETLPIPGKDLHLSLDASLQRAATDALGERRGAVVAIDPNNGGVLAAVSVPAYDPNLFVNGIPYAVYSRLQSSPDRALYNRVTQGQYPPGSTIKPFLSLAGLETGLRLPQSISFCPGFFRLPGKAHRYRCWKKPGHGAVDLKLAMAQSCDVYFYRLAADMGIDELHARLSQFGFGKRTGVDLPEEASGLMPSREWKRRVRKSMWYAGETVITGIGQGYTLATPLQLASAVATLSQQGRQLRPRIVARIGTDEQSREQPEAAIAVEAREENWRRVIDGMVEVVHGARGTARRSSEGASFRFAGKTGTSQLFRIAQNRSVKNEAIAERLRDHALFIAFAPVEDPAIAVAVIVENGESGSAAAAPVARKVLDHYLVGKTHENSNGQPG